MLLKRVEMALAKLDWDRISWYIGAKECSASSSISISSRSSKIPSFHAILDDLPKRFASVMVDISLLT